MTSEERLCPAAVRSSHQCTTSTPPISSVAPCRKALFQKPSPLLKFSESYEGSGNPFIKSSCSCGGQNTSNGRNGHSHFCPKTPSWLRDRSRHSSRGSNNARSFGEFGGRHLSGGSNVTEDEVSKLITEEDFLDVIFFSCDVEKTGKVQTSALLEHIRDTMLPSHMEEAQEVIELRELMDPTGKDPHIDLLTYRNTMTRWIHILQPERCGPMDESLELRTARPIQQSTPCSDSKEAIWRHREARNLSHSHLDPQDIQDIDDVSFGSLEATGGDSFRGDIDPVVDQQSKIDNLQFQLKKMTEQCSKKQKQMESTEDNNAQLAADNDQLRVQLRSTQQVSQRNTSIREENEELKSLMFSTEEDKKHAVKKCSQLEKERESLEVKNRNLHDELEQVMVDSENVQQKFVKLEADLKEYKELCEQTEADLVAKNIENEEKSKKCEVMEASLKELHGFNKALKSEKTELEFKVAELKHDLCTYQQGQSPAVAAATSAVPELYDKCEEDGTPIESLHSELNGLVLADDGLPSPICGASSLRHFDMPEPSPKLDPNSATECLMKEFTQQRDEMQGRIQVLLQQVSVMRENKGNNGYSSDLMTEHLQSDMNSLVGSMTKVVEAKKSSDLRNAKLTDIIKRLRDTNANLSKKYEESNRLVETFSSHENEIEKIRTENENLQMEIQRLKTQANDLEIKLSRSHSELETVKDEAHTLTSTLQTQMECRDIAEQQLQEFKRKHSELEVKSAHNENLVKRLKSDISARDKQLQEEKRSCSELKGSLYISKSTHSAELQSILDVILCDTEEDGESDRESDSQSSGTPSPVNNDEEDSLAEKDNANSTCEVSVEQVRETVQQRLSHLRSRLANSKSSPLMKSRSIDADETKRTSDVKAESLARPNVLLLHGSMERHEQNNNELLRERSSSLTNRKLSPSRTERRHSDQDCRNRTCLSSKDLVNSRPEDVEMSPEDQRLNNQLLSEAREATERFKNRRGRRRSSESSWSSNGERSPVHSGRNSPRERSPEADDRRSSETSSSSRSTGRSSTGSIESPEAVQQTSQEREHVEERTGAEGSSDTEENKSPSCARHNRSRSDSDLDDIDIKADILRNIGPIQSEGGGKLKDPGAKRREEQKLKRNVSFKMPQLSEAQEVNGAKEIDIITNESEYTTQESTISAQQSPPSVDNVKETGPRLRKQDEVEIDTPPRLIPNSVLKALGLASQDSIETTNMTAQEIEDKYNVLASALKLDKYTLKKRIERMKHQRDQSEESMERELSEIQQCLQTLEAQSDNNSNTKECIDRLKKQADDLRQMSVWLAGRAEGLGAVKEEGRLSDAAEVMVCHVENLRRLFEREHAELEEARKLLQENRAFLRSPGSLTSLDGDPDSRIYNRRSLSITPGSKKACVKRWSTLHDSSEQLDERRRASVAVLGLSGTSLSSPTTPFFHQGPLGSGKRSTSRSMSLSSSLNLEDFKEGRSKWSLLANKTKEKSSFSVSRQATTDGATGQTNNAEGEDSPLSSPGSPSGTTSLQTTPTATPRSGSLMVDDTDLPKPSSPNPKTTTEVKSVEVTTKQEEEIYQQGFEQGVRAKVSEELTDLRSQQKSFCDNLETLMENAAEEEEQDEKEQQERVNNAQRRLLPWPYLHDAHRRKLIRLGFAIFLFIIVLISVIIRHLPYDVCRAGQPITNSPLYTLCEIITPFLRVTYESPPPI